MKEPHQIHFIAGLIGVTVFGITSAGSASHRLSADEPGWRSGTSVWNGSGYDLPVRVDAKLPQQVVAVEPPYVVPTDPGVARMNPYFQPGSTNSNPAVGSNAPIRQSDDSVSDLVESFSDPYDQSTTPSKPQIDASDSLYTPTATDVEVKPATPSSESKKLASPTDESPTYTEPLPLEEEVIRWYQYPQQWMKGWDSSAEFGIDGSNGNANTLAIQTGLELKRKTDAHTLALDFDYRQASNRNTTTENNGRVNIDYDRTIRDTKWSTFGKFGMEWDRFKAFDLRLNLNGGLGYHWIKEDHASLVTRFGAGASREIGAPIDDWTPEAVFGVDAERQVNERHKLKAKFDYFPAWDDFNDFRLVADASWEILLDDTDNLSLKLAATDRYDSTPQGAKPNDVYYSLLLLYKF